MKLKFILVCLVLLSLPVQGTIMIDPFTEMQPEVQVGSIANNSYENFGPSIIGGYREIYIRNFAPVSPISFSMSVTNGLLDYTTYTAYNLNNYLLLYYQNNGTGLYLDIDKYKHTGFLRMVLDEPAPDFSVRMELRSHDNYYFSYVVSSMATNVIDVPISNFLALGSVKASDHDLTRLLTVRFNIYQTEPTAAKRSLKINSISLELPPTISDIQYNNNYITLEITNVTDVVTNYVMRSPSLFSPNWTTSTWFRVVDVPIVYINDFDMSSNMFYKVVFEPL